MTVPRVHKLPQREREREGTKGWSGGCPDGGERWPKISPTGRTEVLGAPLCARGPPSPVEEEEEEEEERRREKKREEERRRKKKREEERGRVERERERNSERQNERHKETATPQTLNPEP